MSALLQLGVGPGRPSRERVMVGSLPHIVVANHNLTELFSYLFSLF